MKLFQSRLIYVVLAFSFTVSCATYSRKTWSKVHTPESPQANFLHKKLVAENNLIARSSKLLGDGEVIVYDPDQPTPPFTLFTLSGKYVFPNSSRNNSIIIHVFDTDSAFLECLWASDEALQPLFLAETINNTDFIFISKSAHYDEKFGALWMKNRLETIWKRK